MKKINMKSLQKYIVFFYVYAFLGWIVDVSICFVSDGELVNRGFLYETICPMYGYAALVLIALSKKFKGKGGFLKKVILATVWCTVLEYLTAVILDFFFHLKWWDYSNEPYNFQGRVCLAASIFWGILSVLFMKDIHPFVEKQIKKVSKKINQKIKSIIIYSAVSITFIDSVISIINYLIH